MQQCLKVFAISASIALFPHVSHGYMVYTVDTATLLIGSWGWNGTNDQLVTLPSIQGRNFGPNFGYWETVSPRREGFAPIYSVSLIAWDDDRNITYTFLDEPVDDLGAPNLLGRYSGIYTPMEYDYETNKLIPLNELHWALRNVRDAGGEFGYFSGEFCFSTNSTACDRAFSPVPIPAAAWLLLSGLAGLGFLGRRRKAN